VTGQLRAVDGEDGVLRVILADDRSGTWVPRATPEPSKSPEP